MMHQGADNENHASAKELAEAVREQVEASVVKSQAMKLTEEEAREKYGDSLVIASLEAQVKNGAKETGDLTVRLLFDGTHGGSSQMRGYVSETKTGPQLHQCCVNSRRTAGQGSDSRWTSRTHTDYYRSSACE